jgi:hypothetical protein
MKLKNIIVAAGMLALAATAGEAMAAYPSCKSGSIASETATAPGGAGSGYQANGTIYFTNRYVYLTCDPGAISNNDGAWDGTTPVQFAVSTSKNPDFDQDGKFATILTALAAGKKVTFSATTFNGTIKTLLYIGVLKTSE